jgi:hypothetical protein
VHFVTKGEGRRMNDERETERKMEERRGQLAKKREKKSIFSVTIITNPCL